VLVVSLLVFYGVEAQPGDFAQAVLGQNATPQTLQAFRHALRLDEPAHVRYLDWLWGVAHGDLGRSFGSHRPVAALLRDRFGHTLFLAGLAAVIAVPSAIALGVLAARYRNSWYDRFINALALSCVSFPEFFLAYVLIVLVSLKGGFLPSMSQVSSASGWERVYQSLLPAITLALVVGAHIFRMTRAAILNVLASPYIEMAHLKGVSPLNIVTRHALPNALGPIINVVLLNLTYLLVGVVIVETVFVYPGLGQLLVDSVSVRDFPVVQAVCLLFAATYVALNLLADVLSLVANPRLRHAG
jgi:peptide/nickel transport system permease protein